MTVMPKYFQTVRNITGQVVAGASVNVCNAGLTTQPTLYEDDNVTVITQPLTTDQYGRFEFSTNPGAYDIYIRVDPLTIVVYLQVTMGSPGGSGAVDSVNTRTGAVTLGGGDIPAFIGSGSTHAPGAVPDPGGTTGVVRFLCEDVANPWKVPPNFIGGANHAPGYVPDPGGTVEGTRCIFDDGVWRDPSAFASTYFYIQIQEQQPIGTSAGTFTTGAWQDRVLNTLVTDTSGLVTLSANEITLQEGSYLFDGSFPAFNVLNHVAQLLNVTDGVVVATGTAEYATTGVQTRSHIRCRFSIGTGLTKVYKVQHQCIQTQAGNGLGAATGLPSSGQKEIYSDIVIMQEPPVNT